MDEDSWSAAVLAEPTGSGKFRPVLVVTRRRGAELSDVVVPLYGEYPSRLAAEEAGKDALAAMSLGE